MKSPAGRQSRRPYWLQRQYRYRRGLLSALIGLVAVALAVILLCQRGATGSLQGPVIASRADARMIERASARRVTSPPRIEDELAETADHAGDDSQREDRLTFLLPSCEPDPRVLSLLERRLKTRGGMQTTLTPKLASSRASGKVRLTTPPLEAA